MDEVSIGEFARRARLSVSALRLYDERGVLVPVRVDRESGYRYYDLGQVPRARLVAMLRQLDMPLAAVKEALDCDPVETARQVAEHWRQAESSHAARRKLADYLVTRLSGKESPPMYEVATRDMPERSLLCLKRNVDEQGAWAFGKEFVAIFRERPAPRMPRTDGREGAAFCIYWGQVSADSDGPLEWCRPIPAHQAKALAAQYPELTLRVELAHREAYVPVPVGASLAQWQLVSEALYAWAAEYGITPEKLSLTPDDLGSRITYLASEPITETSVPDTDFAVPFARSHPWELTQSRRKATLPGSHRHSAAR